MPEKGPQAGGTGGSETPKRHLDTRSPLGARPVPKHRKWPGDKRLTLKKYPGGSQRLSQGNREQAPFTPPARRTETHSFSKLHSKLRPSSVSGDSAIKAGKTDKGLSPETHNELQAKM